MLAAWQREVLGETEAPFRASDAYAKAGRERYGLTPRTQADFAACLREATGTEFPLAARAARAYLDVAFFHPFTDRNARAALLTLVHVLAREDIVLPQVGPLQITRYADDPAGAADLATLIGVLPRRLTAWPVRNDAKSRPAPQGAGRDGTGRVWRVRRPGCAAAGSSSPAARPGR
ncbi:hypothetical protein ACFU8W_26620 [Streptomyces sp. NPDC057565]|uniref:hypothetical protein n=1 Tax=Streptomyces sp. NPDC057565 TaxID=3346169 RepID=UPI0036C5C4F7